MPYFVEVTTIPNNPFEQTYLSLSSIYLNNEVYDSAYIFFDRLEKVAGGPDNIRAARIGLLRSAYDGRSRKDNNCL
ncbi:MAG: hypothetical protein R2744_01950 [Bacteroidales bacterium]